MSPSLALVVVVSAALVAQTPPSHHEALKDVAWWVGTWDVKGKMSDGREFKGQHTWRWSLDKNFLAGEIVSSGDGKKVEEAKFIVGWDPITKEIKGWEFWKDGYRGTFAVTERGTHLEGLGEGPDGAEKWTGITNLSDDTNSYTYKATIKRANGTEAVFQFKAARKEASQKRADHTETTGIPPDALKALQFFVGKFKGETFENGEKIGGGTDERKWMPGKYCILMTGTDTEGGEERYSVGLSGWDAKGQQLVETWHVSNGLHAIVRYPLSGIKPGSWQGNFTVTFGDGRGYDGTCVLVIEDKGWTWTAHWKEGATRWYGRASVVD